ncbi:MAG: ExbD/TolR family protein [Steroidobacteraceae bacterium]|jgi:biopolymer transport protein ExbD
MSMQVGPGGDEMCDINTTPLIDVMLVLLVTLIITLPVMTHAVKLDMPDVSHPPPPPPVQPEVIDLDIDFDGTVVWNGTPVASIDTLESYFHSEADKEPQPEIHLRPDRRAKYDVVARVLAAAQRNRMKKIGFVNTAEFSD